MHTPTPQVTIPVIGRFDFAGHRTFRDAYKAALAAHGIKQIIIDLSRCEYMDSSALGTLLLLRSQAEDISVTIEIHGTTGIVRKVLEVANFQRLFKIV